MSFVLDNSVTMRWFFGDGKLQELAYAGKVLDALRDTRALVPATWGLEVANVIARAEAKGLVTEARSGEFLELLEGVDIEPLLLTRCLPPSNSRGGTGYPLTMPHTSNWHCDADCPWPRSTWICRKPQRKRA